MLVLFAIGCEYALQTVLYLASRSRNTLIHQRGFSEAFCLPSHFLGKILQRLSHRRRVVSQKSKAGGLCFAGQLATLPLIRPIFLSDRRPGPIH